MKFEIHGVIIGTLQYRDFDGQNIHIFTTVLITDCMFYLANLTFYIPATMLTSRLLKRFAVERSAITVNVHVLSDVSIYLRTMSFHVIVCIARNHYV